MANTAPEQSESMEDILHSIRRIIANEPDGHTAAAPDDEEPLELTEVAPAAVEEEPLELTDVIAERAAAIAAQLPPKPEKKPAPAPVVETPPPAPPPPVVAAPPPPPPPPVPAPVAPVKVQAESLITQNVAEASAHALKNLVDSIPKPKIDSPMLRSGSTLEDLVVESLRPELSQWLNTNLPVLVQSLVEKEIRKLIPRD